MMESIASMDARAKRDFWLFMLFALLVLGAGIGMRDPWPADEPRFTLVAKQMIESGDWLIPRRGVEIYADKPPTFMLLEAVAYRISGNWRIAFLLPSLLAALGTLVLVYDLARRLWTRKAGSYAAAALLCAFQFAYQSKRAPIDPTVTFLITLANYGLLRHFLLGPDWRAFWLGCFAAGLGVITKGVGVLALLMFIPYLFGRWRHWEGIAPIANGTWRWPLGLLAFLFALALWLLPMLLAVQRDGSPEMLAYAHDILFHQTAARYADSWDHAQPWWYFATVICTGWLPLTLALPGAIPAWRERLRAHDARVLLPLSWVAMIIVFFSIPGGKRDMYILPALPMFALCISPFLPEIVGRLWARRTAIVFTTLLGAAFVCVGFYAMCVFPPPARDMVAQRGLADEGMALWSFVVTVGAWMLVCAAFFRQQRGVHALLAGIAGLWILFGFWGYPVLNDSSSARASMLHAGQIIGPDAELALVAWKEQNMLMADRRALDFGFSKPWSEQLGQAIRWQEAKPANRWVLILADAMGSCVDQGKSRYLGHANRREWWLFRADAVQAACAGGKVPEQKIGTDPNAE